MLAIKTDASNWNGETLLGQFGDEVVLEVETEPEYKHEAYTGSMLQRCLPGNYGETMTYAELKPIKTIFEELGEEALGAKSIEELKYRKKQQDYITSLKLALVDLYEGSL